MEQLTERDKRLLAQAATAWVSFDLITTSGTLVGELLMVLVTGGDVSQIAQDATRTVHLELAEIPERLRVIRRVMDKLGIEVPDMDIPVSGGVPTGIDLDVLMQTVAGTD